MIRGALLSLFTALAISLSAAAQDFFMPGTSPLALNTIQGAGLNSHIGNLSLGGVATGRAAPRRPEGQAAAGAPYRATPQLARESVQAFLGRARQQDPAGAQALAEQFSRHDYRAVYRGLIAGTGLREDDALDALTAYTVLGWLIANNVTSDPRPEHVLGVRRQLAGAIAGNAAFTQPETRAQVGEEFKLLLIVVHAGWQSAGREGTLRAYSDAIASHYARNGSNLRAMRLTEAGFAAR